jgi:cell division protein FtsL
MRKKISQAIEKFKIIQRIIMVILTVAMIVSMCFIGYEIREMNKTIGEMNTHVQETVNAINLLQQTLKRSIWF